MHKGIHQVFKPMLESGIKSEVFAPVKKKYQTATSKPKPRTALLQGEENNVTISNTTDKPPTKEGPRIISKPRMMLLKAGENIITTISAPTTTVAVNSINPIQIQFGTLCFGVKIEDDENNMSNKNRR
jgi:beta-glucanase (GH16 family)